MEKKETFSRWGIILAGLGMAVGTGNLWRFPRIVAQYGGGAFLIAWLLFLFIWAIPLLVIELSIGKNSRKGVIGSFGKLMGQKYSWMGTFVAFVTAAITFYYTVVVGWCLKYFFATVFQGLTHKHPLQFWRHFSSSWQPVLFQLFAIGIGCFIIYFGVTKGIERANRIFIPTLFIILVVACIRALTLPGALKGLDYIFSPKFHMLADPEVWMNALSQCAWSTGAGWGLMLTYAVYAHKKENSVLTATTLGFGDYLASLLAAVTVIPTVFAFFSSQPGSLEKSLKVMETDNVGLTFIWIPELFSKIPSGTFFLALFFLGLCFAAFSSLLSQLELITRVFMDAGFLRKKAVKIVGVTCFVLGLPSALSMGFFNNQDWVWGLGLMVSGSFFIVLLIKIRPEVFRQKIFASYGKYRLGKAFDILVKYLLPVQIIAMLGWWFWNSYSQDPHHWYKIISPSSLGTVLFQWITALIVFILLNKFINRKTFKEKK
ncbi:sodium-dependent transporter [bacterium]|nr:sodium-dependent transporter [bacterium]